MDEEEAEGEEEEEREEIMRKFGDVIRGLFLLCNVSDNGATKLYSRQRCGFLVNASVGRLN